MERDSACIFLIPVDVCFVRLLIKSISVLILSRGSGGRSLSSGRSNVLRSVGGRSLRSLGVVFSLVRAVNSNLNGDLTTLNDFAVHLGNSLLLHLLRSQCDKSEATTLARLTASLELLDHEAGDRAQGDLGRDRLVILEQFLQLFGRAFG